VSHTVDAVICGAGIAGVAVAHELTQRGLTRVLLVDDRAPLTLTSDKSTEAYRNWWPGPDDAMVQLMNRAIDRLEQWAEASDNRFLLNRRGYLYCTARADRAAQFEADAARAGAQGAGPVRVYRSRDDLAAYAPSAATGWRDHPTGADLFLGADVIHAQFPWLAPDLVAVLHARRCGWFSGQQLGAYLLEDAKARGAVLMSGRVTAVHTAQDVVTGVRVIANDGTTHDITTSTFVNCAGPFAKAVGALAGQALPLFSEAHYKVSIEDPHQAVDRGTGLVILDDPQQLEWSPEERAELAADESTRWLTEPLPAGIHLRPEGYGASSTVLMLWDYHSAHRFEVPEYPLPDDPFYPEVVLRGMTRLAPGLARYLDRLPHNYVDGGYYTKTVENRPLVGAAGVRGAFVCAGFSGFGLMAAPACAELVADAILGVPTPPYAAAVAPGRFDDPAYLARLERWGSTGQL
jgi:glycine/D-amino acid oxidase-like deaminating enzyme